MEMLDGSRRLIGEWETSGMEEDVSGCGGEAGLHRQNALILYLRQRETRLKRMAQFLTVALLLLITVALALLVMVATRGRVHRSPDSQPAVQPVSHSSGISDEQQQREDRKNPSAMLTVPQGESNHGDYLEWETETGNAFCQGGFNYSGGYLVVPRNGIYRVFLQITYESMNSFNCGNPILINMVLMLREAYSKEVNLLSSVDTVKCGIEPWRKSLYTSGLFFLEANSRLRVTASHPGFIVKKEYQVFFGAELLPQ